MINRPKSNRYLTKSRFKLALECPTKLYYTRKPAEYKDNSLDDRFLRALAWGGYQVGELAKYYYPGGIEITAGSYEESLTASEKYLRSEEVTLFEPAICYRNLLVRVDVLVKKGNELQLIEVKAKSFKSADEFTTRRGTIDSKWKAYLYDVAFQKYVLQKAYPEYKVSSHLLLVDKTKSATVEGLNQRFFIARGAGNEVEIIPRNTTDLGYPILTPVNVDELVEKIWNEDQELLGHTMNFEEYIWELAEYYEKDEPVWERVRKECRSCQYRLALPIENDLKSGFHQCWEKMANLKLVDLHRPMTIDIWDNRPPRSDNFLGQGWYFQDQVDPADLGTASDTPSKTGLQRVERQALQVNMARETDPEYYLDHEGLMDAVEGVQYPLHFIDFETTMVPLPFFRGQRPYEQIAFQFSHHTLDESGKVVHQTQWINDEPGKFPNFRFVRELKKALSNNQGTIFRYAAHENTVLCQLYDQLAASEEPDREELMHWIQTITYRYEREGSSKTYLWKGERNMVDLLDLVKRFYYDPVTNGSNSLKAVLPASILRSRYIQEVYSKPVYGEVIRSLNFREHTWLQPDGEGGYISPYQQLPEIYEGWTRDELDRRVHPDDDLDDGGAAMTAYNMMQFTEMEDKERQRIISALLKYCELDTLAMVMLWEFWMRG